MKPSKRKRRDRYYRTPRIPKATLAERVRYILLFNQVFGELLEETLIKNTLK